MFSRASPLIGSSPLARGLRGHRVTVRPDGGIIPARAGFTNPGADSVPGLLDHPRSRGVYATSLFTGCEWKGSSPLARGLLFLSTSPMNKSGIIPARAGFTWCASPSCSGAGDHPRSRGVYNHSQPHTHGRTGSSPLARGLPHGREYRRDGTGIIPARAGFTQPGGGGGSAEDHPRSRGVYRGRRRPPGNTRGSSPLARGLRRPPIRLSSIRRIIPARAGFTAPSWSAGTSSGDHPRSRGVYRLAPHTPNPPAGSSPLARGLLFDHTLGGADCGIIPARAGFTCITRATRVHARDHPRSRGVYSGAHFKLPGGRGSSPLARGLPTPNLRQCAQAGIIPARAGFTPRSR